MLMFTNLHTINYQSTKNVNEVRNNIWVHRSIVNPTDKVRQKRDQSDKKICVTYVFFLSC